MWLILFVILNILDAVSTKVIMNDGGHELNPIMRLVLNQPDWVFWTVKVLTPALVAGIIHEAGWVWVPKALVIGMIIVVLINVGGMICR